MRGGVDLGRCATVQNGHAMGVQGGGGDSEAIKGLPHTLAEVVQSKN